MDSVIKTTGFFNSFDGSSVYYEVRGQGVPVIFCYGVGCLFNHWSPQTRFFSHHHQAVLMDYRGHHRTPIPENKESLTIDALAQDLIALCDHLEIAKAHFVGHSFGVQVLFCAYEKAPERFRSLVAVNGLYRNPFNAMVDAPTLVEMINQCKKIYNLAPGFLSQLWTKGVTNPLLVPLSALTGGFNLSKTSLKDIEIYAKGVASIDVRVFLTFFEQMIESNFEKVLTKIQVPTLIIAGSKDGLTPMDEQKRMHELILGSELYVVPYGSHCTQLDFPEMVNLKIQQFFEQEKKLSQHDKAIQA